MAVEVPAGEGLPAVRILVVDDEPTLVEWLTLGLSFEGYQVDVARSGPEALQAARARPPALIVLDLMLPGLDGLEVIRQLRRQSNVPVIMLTARGEVEDRIRGLDLGGDDYLVKPVKFAELLARIKAVLRRYGVHLHAVLRAGDVTLDRETREVTRDGRTVELTPREFDLLELFLAHPRQVFPREVILSRIWGYEYLTDTNVIDVHIRYLREKLGDDDRSLIRNVRGVGYTLQP